MSDFGFGDDSVCRVCEGSGEERLRVPSVDIDEDGAFEYVDCGACGGAGEES